MWWLSQTQKTDIIKYVHQPFMVGVFFARYFERWLWYKEISMKGGGSNVNGQLTLVLENGIIKTDKHEMV